ncbi:MAG: hypothetical protein L0Z62_16350 [Gemmataceae bacterium]|nr:hypothetical protein [Gemmataceae bacterium]
MPEVQILDNTKYGKALRMLYQMGCNFQTRPFHILLIGPGAYQELEAAGLVEPNGTKVGKRTQSKRGQKTKEV